MESTCPRMTAGPGWPGPEPARVPAGLPVPGRGAADGSVRVEPELQQARVDADGRDPQADREGDARCVAGERNVRGRVMRGAHGVGPGGSRHGSPGAPRRTRDALRGPSVALAAALPHPATRGPATDRGSPRPPPWGVRRLSSLPDDGRHATATGLAAALGETRAQLRLMALRAGRRGHTSGRRPGSRGSARGVVLRLERGQLADEHASCSHRRGRAPRRRSRSGGTARKAWRARARRPAVGDFGRGASPGRRSSSRRQV